MSKILIKKKIDKPIKESPKTIEEERNLLKLTLDHLAKENSELKTTIGDLKVTLRANKELLREYVEKITNKDKVVVKMSNTIEMLQSRLHSLDEFNKTYNKYKSSNNLNSVPHAKTEDKNSNINYEIKIETNRIPIIENDSKSMNKEVI